MKQSRRQTVTGKTHPVVKRFVAAVTAAVVWSTVSLTGLELGWVLLGAACIGMLATIGIEPPRRRRRRRREVRAVPAPTLV